MTKPKPIYDAAISYRTPAGRLVRYRKLIAADTLSDCEERLRGCLNNEQKFGRRKIAVILDDFSASFYTMQIATR